MKNLFKVFFIALILSILNLARAMGGGGHSTYDPEALAKARPQCPGVIEQLVTVDDKSGGFLGFINGGVKPADCTKELPKTPYNAIQAEENFAKNPATQLDDLPANFINQCLATPRRGPRNKTYVPNISEADKKGIIGDYYWVINRLREQGQANVEAIAGVDLVLGKDGASMLWRPGDKEAQHWHYSTPLLPGTKKFEADVRQCPALPKDANGKTSEFNSMVARTQSALFKLWQLEKQKEQVPLVEVPNPYGYGGYGGYSSYGAYGGYGGYGGTIRVRDPEKIKAIEQAQEMIRNTVPWIRGKEASVLEGKTYYSKSSDPWPPSSFNVVAEALEKQLYAKRRMLHKQIQDLTTAANCINSPSWNSGCVSDIRETLDGLRPYEPWKKIQGEQKDENGEPLDIRMLPQEEKNRVQWTRFYMADAQCRYDMRGAKKMAGDAIKQFAFDATLTIASMGALSILNAGKAAIIAGRAAQLSMAAQAARGLIIGTEVVTLSVSGKKAVDTCTQAYEGKLSQIPDLFGNNNEASCQNRSEEAQAVYGEFMDCMQASAMVVAGAALSTIGNVPLLRPVKTPVQRLSAAGFAPEAAEEIMAGLKAAKATPTKIVGVTVSSGENAVIKQNKLVLDTLEKMGPDFAKTVTSPAHRRALGEALGTWQEFAGKKWDPAKAADLFKSISKGNAEGLESLNTALQEANKLNAANPSLGKMGALQKYLETAGLEGPDVKGLLGCLGNAL